MATSRVPSMTSLALLGFEGVGVGADAKLGEVFAFLDVEGVVPGFGA